MGYRILIVEDNPQNRLLVKDVLEFYGYEIMEAEDGQTSIEMAKKYKPDLIFMDLQMPVMDGFTAGKIIRGDTDTKNTKMIAVTSNNNVLKAHIEEQKKNECRLLDNMNYNRMLFERNVIGLAFSRPKRRSFRRNLEQRSRIGRQGEKANRRTGKEDLRNRTVEQTLCGQGAPDEGAERENRKV